MFYRVEPDDDVQGVEEWYKEGKLGTVVTWHRKYCIGDVQPKESPSEWRKRHQRIQCIYPVYMLDNSGLALSMQDFNDPWDSGQLGLIYATRETLRKNRVKSHEKAKEIFQSELETLQSLINGEVWCYVIYDDDGESVLASCGGYLDYAECEDAAKVELAEQRACRTVN